MDADDKALEQMDLSLLEGIGRQPVDTAQPAGRDVREDLRFDALQLEIGKLANPAADGQTDWQRVGQLAAVLLAEKGKDLLVAAYLNAALLHAHGLPGLSAGLQIVGDLVEHHWEGMQPPLARVRARRNAMQWLLERAEWSAGAQGWSELAPQTPAMVAALLATVGRLDEQLREKDDQAPSFRPLRALIERVPVAEELPLPAVPAVPAKASNAAGDPQVPAPPVGAGHWPVLPEAAAGADPADALAPAFDYLNRVVDAMMAANPLDERAYRASRFANWAGLEALPPVTGGLTQISAPIEQVAEALRRMQDDAAEAQDAVAFAEAQFTAFPLWLDLQALCADALARCGEAGAGARAEVERASRELLQRLPGLEGLCFANGMPFANAQTLAWIATLAVGTSSAGSAVTAGDGLGTVTGQARTLAASGALDAAVSLMQQAIHRAPDAAGRLRAQIRLCQLLSAHREGRVPVPFAQLIVEQIRHHDLARWEPALATEGWIAAFAVFNQDDTHAGERDAALAAIARLDAAQAIALV